MSFNPVFPHRRCTLFLNLAPRLFNIFLLLKQPFFPQLEFFLHLDPVSPKCRHHVLLLPSQELDLLLIFDPPCILPNTSPRVDFFVRRFSRKPILIRLQPSLVDNQLSLPSLELFDPNASTNQELLQRSCLLFHLFIEQLSSSPHILLIRYHSSSPKLRQPVLLFFQCTNPPLPTTFFVAPNFANKPPLNIVGTFSRAPLQLLQLMFSQLFLLLSWTLLPKSPSCCYVSPALTTLLLRCFAVELVTFFPPGLVHIFALANSFAELVYLQPALLHGFISVLEMVPVLLQGLLLKQPLPLHVLLQLVLDSRMLPPLHLQAIVSLNLHALMRQDGWQTSPVLGTRHGIV